jgi:hypothetical protein
MPRGRWLVSGVAALVVAIAGPRDAVAADRPLPWSRGTLAPGVALGVGPGSDITSLSFGVGLDYFVSRGFSLGLTFSDELLIYSSSTRGRLPSIEDQLPTNIFYIVPTARWVFFRRFRFSPYVFAGIGPAFFNNDNGIVGHWQAGPSAYIGLVGGLFLDLGVVFSGKFPASRCDRAFVYRPPEASAGPVQLSECAFSWAPKIGIAYAFGFGEQRERRKRREGEGEGEGESESESESEPESESESESEPESASESEPESESESEAEAPGPVPDAEPVPELEAAPAVGPEPVPDAHPAPDPDPAPSGSRDLRR